MISFLISNFNLKISDTLLLFILHYLPFEIMNIEITVYPSYGGSEIVGSVLGRELALRGQTVHFISFSLLTHLIELSDKIQFH